MWVNKLASEYLTENTPERLGSVWFFFITGIFCITCVQSGQTFLFLACLSMMIFPIYFSKLLITWEHCLAPLSNCGTSRAGATVSVTHRHRWFFLSILASVHHNDGTVDHWCSMASWQCIFILSDLWVSFHHCCPCGFSHWGCWGCPPPTPPP